jgi:TruD family tRNA pseudouridine synthase
MNTNGPQNRFSLWQKEKILLDELKQLRPELFYCEKKQSSTILREIGIDTNSKEKPKGYIKYLPFDFIVEEIETNGNIISVDNTGSKITENIELAPTIYAELVKIGISSIEAVEQLSKALNCDKKQISYAGIKDTVAITGQKISLRNLDFNSVKDLSIPQLFLKNFSFGKGAVFIGDLKGNRFTILIRTQEDFDIEKINEKVSIINKQGLYNYYGPQRFGSPRYISHVFGKHLCQGNFEKVVRDILTQTSKFEWDFVTKMREKASVFFGDWQKMKDIFINLPNVFKSELELLERLSKWDKKGDIWIHGLGYAPEQIDFWTKSYASYLVNKILNSAEKNNQVIPEKIPLLLNISEFEKTNISQLYDAFLKEDSTLEFRKNLKKIPWLRMGENSYLNTKIFPNVLGIKNLPEGVAIVFDLPKGAYATTLLYELFDIVEGEEEMEFIKKDYVDTKKELGVGSFESIRQWAEQYIESYDPK